MTYEVLRCYANLGASIKQRYGVKRCPSMSPSRDGISQAFTQRVCPYSVPAFCSKKHACHSREDWNPVSIPTSHLIQMIVIAMPQLTDNGKAGDTLLKMAHDVIAI